MDEQGGTFSVQIKYSVMQPGTHVWPHTGPTNCRLRMHLGLVIPKEGCKIQCANETRYVSSHHFLSYSSPPRMDVRYDKAMLSWIISLSL